ncbi:hypothetical protein KIN20_016097 [Parelaphostrongylus tenuis]|uniref:Uncharacterized protein n=1 Tax=Parelaphostrongylus tenuis TaxID=148309 RepID=A0AAD5MFY0_PARTN|nr:hypothetical protein KIN20_016097 [Parelaphostrongylus tenuis]
MPVDGGSTQNELSYDVWNVTEYHQIGQHLTHASPNRKASLMKGCCRNVIRQILKKRSSTSSFKNQITTASQKCSHVGQACAGTFGSVKFD